MQVPMRSVVTSSHKPNPVHLSVSLATFPSMQSMVYQARKRTAARWERPWRSMMPHHVPTPNEMSVMRFGESLHLRTSGRMRRMIGSTTNTVMTVSRVLIAFIHKSVSSHKRREVRGRRDDPSGGGLFTFEEGQI